MSWRCISTDFYYKELIEIGAKPGCLFYLAPGLICEGYWKVNSRRSIFRIADPSKLASVSFPPCVNESFERFAATPINILVRSRKITDYKMDNAHTDVTDQASIRLQDLYLTGVRYTGKDIGVGAYGKVFEVEYCGTIFAAKQVHSILLEGVQQDEFEATKKAFLTECIRSSSLAHPNIVLFLGVYNPGGQSLLPVLVMERMQESLTSAVEKYPNIPMYVKLSMLLDVSQGLWYLHTHHPPIVHRDLSPNNVLLTSHFVAKISDLGVAKVIQADSKKTKTRVPGTVDFMPPEALLETPEYGPPLDVFSYGGVILHVVNQEWPKPLHYVMTDPKTGKILGLTEVERRQQHMKKMAGTLGDLRALVKQCLDNQPSKRPLISDVSERMKRMKEVESVKCSHVNMDPIAWLQVEQATKMLREATITTPIAKVKVRGV